MRLWDYAQTILRSGKLQISYAKAELGPNKSEFCAKNVEKNYKIGSKKYRQLYYLYYICIIYALYVYYMYILYVLIYEYILYGKHQ